MSFREHVTKARDPERGVWRRMSAVKACVASFCWLTRLPYRATLERLGLTWSVLVPSPPPTEAYLAGVLAAVERERGRYLAGLAAFEEMRRERKRGGNRQMSAKEARMLADLRAAVDFGGEAPSA